MHKNRVFWTTVCKEIIFPFFMDFSDEARSSSWQLLLVSTLCIICLNSGCLVKKQPRISNISYSKGQVSYGCYSFHLFQRRFPVMVESINTATQ